MELSCYACGATHAHAPGRRCDCGQPLFVESDAGRFSWRDAETADAPGMWRFADLLPVEAPDGLAAAAGGTPCFRAPALDDRVGARVHLKYEGANPTGSFKDRGSAVGVTHAVRSGARAVGTVSHGNMARSVAAHAAAADLPCVVLVPEDIPPERLGTIARHDPTIVQVRGDYGELYRRSLDLGREHDVAFVNSDAPLRVAGQKTTALELAARFPPDGPEAVVIPTSSGGHASGAWQAVRDLRAAGLGEGPRLYFAQAAPCAPIAEAYGRGDEAVTPVEAGETVAYSIANADPPSGDRVLTAARDTGGGVLAVPDAETEAALERLATDVGLSVQPSCAVALAAAERLGERGEFGADEAVAVVMTGTGLAESAGAADVESVDLPDLGQRLAAV